MTREEWLVIAAAAAAFVIINIIMWTVIAIKEKREKRRSAVPPDISNALLKAAEGLNTASANDNAADTPLSAEAPKAAAICRREDFTVVTSIIMVNTEETID